MALDLTRPEECEKAELTLRYACLTQYMVQRLFAGQASDAAQAEALVLTLAHGRRRLPGAPLSHAPKPRTLTQMTP